MLLRLGAERLQPKGDSPSDTNLLQHLWHGERRDHHIFRLQLSWPIRREGNHLVGTGSQRLLPGEHGSRGSGHLADRAQVAFEDLEGMLFLVIPVLLPRRWRGRTGWFPECPLGMADIVDR